MVHSYTLFTGAASAYSATLQCAQFDDDFVEALKGNGRTFVCCVYLFHHHQPYLRMLTSSMFNSLLHMHKPVSYPGRSYHGPPAQQCSNCKAVFWNAESVGKEARTSSGSPIYNKCCKGGRIVIPPFLPRPEPLASLARFDGGSVSNKFMKNIRRYNCLFAFSSMGAKIDRTMNDGRGPPVFKICGQIHHRIGSLIPPHGRPPKFIQLYVYDTSAEVENRIASLESEDTIASDLDPTIVQSLVNMLDEHNLFAKQFRMARDRFAGNDTEDFVIRIVGPKNGDPPQYSLPATDQLAMLVVGDFSCEEFQRDIIVQKQTGDLDQISALHPAFMALQYPLLFPYAERGWQTGVLYTGATQSAKNAHVKLTMQDYYCYMFHYRRNEPNPYLCYGPLSTQAKVDARACVDENRLKYIMDHQADIRMESIQGICDAISRGSEQGSEVGKMTVLPASYTGGRRYMIQNYHDGIAICREYGPPDFFVTFTCNPKWLEISEAIFEPGQRPSDRNDIAVRVFNIKLEELLHDIRCGTPFGPCNAGIFIYIHQNHPFYLRPFVYYLFQILNISY